MINFYVSANMFCKIEHLRYIANAEFMRLSGSVYLRSQMSTGDTLEELYQSLNEAMEGYFEVKQENNLPIPVPGTVDKYS